MSKFTIHAAARIGHVNLKVADMGRALAFYCDVLGLRIRRYRPGSRLAARDWITLPFVTRVAGT
jgi:catechol 2,3-dioxygenase-like lactoylglutathione lyase family enzyme